MTALAVAAKLLRMQAKGDFLEGDVFVSTHVCPDAPTAPHEPVPFMNSPVETWQVNKEEVTDDLDAVLVVDTTKGKQDHQPPWIRNLTDGMSGIYFEGQRGSSRCDADDNRKTSLCICSDTAGYHALWKWNLPFKQHPAACDGDKSPGGRRCDHDGDDRCRMCNGSYPYGRPG